MLKTIKAHYKKGRIEPVEPLTLEEGAELEVTVSVASPSQEIPDPTKATAGAWRTLLNCEQFEDEVYQSRLLRTRPDISL